MSPARVKWSAELRKANIPVVLAGDFNVVPTDADKYPTDHGTMMRSCSPKAGRRSVGFSVKAGRMEFGRSILRRRFTPTGTTSGIAGRGTRACGSITCYCLRRSSAVCYRRASTAGFAACPTRAITHPPGSNSKTEDFAFDIGMPSRTEYRLDLDLRARIHHCGNPSFAALADCTAVLRRDRVDS